MRDSVKAGVGVLCLLEKCPTACKRGGEFVPCILYSNPKHHCIRCLTEPLSCHRNGMHVLDMGVRIQLVCEVQG